MMMLSEFGTSHPLVLDQVALLADRPADKLWRGQVGMVVDAPDDDTLMVEFSDPQGNIYARAPCRHEELLVLHHQPHMA